jgi:PPK2 family polyphosphate:nucleotide phosphotransferase
MMDQFRVSKSDFRLSDYDPADTRGLDERECEAIVDRNRQRIADWQNTLYAEKKQALLVVLQSMDTAGKDPIIRDVLDLANSQACRVTHFKKPGGPEAEHDQFWRFHKAVPARGEIGVFNRSYYDETIAADAHDELSDAERCDRYRQFGLFEDLLASEQIAIVKIFLHIDKEEQKRRLQERIDDPARHWELSEKDFTERQFWDGYMRAYERVLQNTSFDFAPWYLITSNRKWFRDAAASTIIADALERLNPQFPPPKIDLNHIEWH